MKDVIIVGGGLAGLACGIGLARRGLSFTILEATDRAGGRVRTDRVEGFTLDHGFQVLLTAYPTCRELLDYRELQLCRFTPGALVRKGRGVTELVDPWRHPLSALSVALSPVGSFADKLRLGSYRKNLRKVPFDDLFSARQEPTQAHLKRLGFTDTMIDSFFRPFFGGITLDTELETSSRVTDFVFQMFATGDAAVPASGMDGLAHQLVDQLPQGSLQFQKSVVAVSSEGVTTSQGELLPAKNVVIATEEGAAARLLNRPPEVRWRPTTCVYFAADQAPYDQPLLCLAGEDHRGPVNHLAVLSNVAPQYAPPGQSLICANVVGEVNSPETIELDVLAHLKNWYGEAVHSWRHLRTYSIPYALPAQPVDRMEPVVKSPRLAENLFRCGDYCDFASLEGALRSGLRAAAAIGT